MWSFGQERGWRCLDEDTLGAYVEQKVFGGKRESIEHHLAACEACRDQIGFLLRAQAAPSLGTVPADWLARARALSQAKTPARAAAWRWGAAAATACVVVALILGLKPHPASKPSGDTLASPPLAQLVEPPAARTQGATVTSPTVRSHTYAMRVPEVIVPKPHSTVAQKAIESRWKEMPGAIGYQLRLADAEGDVLWEQRTQKHSVTIPASLTLKPGETYFLWVRAYLPEGKTAQSKAISFTIAR